MPLHAQPPRPRFLELHKQWKSLRDDQIVDMDKRMIILPGVFPVGCKLESESASYTAVDGLRAVDEALSKQTSVVSRVPPSWIAARSAIFVETEGEKAGYQTYRAPVLFFTHDYIFQTQDFSP